MQIYEPFVLRRVGLDSRVNDPSVECRVPSLLAEDLDAQLALRIHPDVDLRALAIVLCLRPNDRGLLEHLERILGAAAFRTLRYLRRESGQSGSADREIDSYEYTRANTRHRGRVNRILLYEVTERLQIREHSV